MGVNQSKFTGQVTGAIKAELGRRDLDGVDLVGPLGMSRNSVYARLNGMQPFDTDQIEKVAVFLGMTVDQLLESARLGDTPAHRAVA
jgi:hypothetical protein